MTVLYYRKFGSLYEYLLTEKSLIFKSFFRNKISDINKNIKVIKDQSTKILTYE